MAIYYAQISGPANITTNFNPYTNYTGNGNYLRLEYVGDITTDATSYAYVWNAQHLGVQRYFVFRQDTYQQYLSLGSTTYVTNVDEIPDRRRKFNSDSLSNPAIFELHNGTANLTFNNITTTGPFSGSFGDNNLIFFPTSNANNLRMNFYELKVYGSGNTLLFDFVPGWNGMHTSRGIIDKVSGNFFTPSSGTYIDLVQIPEFEPDDNSFSVTYTGLTTATTLNAEGLSWTATTVPSWVTVSPSTGSGTTSISIAIAQNNSNSPRTGSIVFTSSESDTAEIAITQAKHPLLVPNENIYKADLEVIKAYRSGSTINKAYRSGELIYYKLNYPEPTPPGPGPEETPLTFNIISSGTINWKAYSSSYTKDIQYSVNDGPWSSITSSTGGTPISLNTGDVVRFKGDGAISTGSSAYNTFCGSTAIFEASGNVASLIDSTNYATVTTVAAHSFRYLFQEVTGLTSAENLVLQATTLAQQCYFNMFAGCTSLTTAPVLPATTLADYCYRFMFYGCSSLNYIKCLATDISASLCTNQWVVNVASEGTFVTPSSTNWTTGVDGIPSGWTRVDA